MSKLIFISFCLTLGSSLGFAENPRGVAEMQSFLKNKNVIKLINATEKALSVAPKDEYSVPAKEGTFIGVLFPIGQPKCLGSYRYTLVFDQYVSGATFMDDTRYYTCHLPVSVNDVNGCEGPKDTVQAEEIECTEKIQ